MRSTPEVFLEQDLQFVKDQLASNFGDDFSTGTDKIDIATVGSYVEADGTSTANLAAFITAADASLPTTSIDIYAQYNFKGEGNTLVVIDEDKSGAVNTGDTLIILTGLSTAGGLDASDFI